MGCGCRKKTVNRSSQNSPTLKSSMIPFSIYKKRKSKCFSCKKFEGGKCRKINKLVAIIIRDPYFKCPLGKFDRII